MRKGCVCNTQLRRQLDNRYVGVCCLRGLKKVIDSLHLIWNPVHSKVGTTNTFLRLAPHFCLGGPGHMFARTSSNRPELRARLKRVGVSE
jgi:hypothetical protein